MMIKDEIGTHKVIQQRNGIVVKILKEPSKKYKEKLEKIDKENKKRLAEKKKMKDKEKMIQEKMRELAIKELEKEGKI